MNIHITWQSPEIRSARKEEGCVRAVLDWGNHGVSESIIKYSDSDGWSYEDVGMAPPRRFLTLEYLCHEYELPSKIYWMANELNPDRDIMPEVMPLRNRHIINRKS